MKTQTKSFNNSYFMTRFKTLTSEDARTLPYAQDTPDFSFLSFFIFLLTKISNLDELRRKLYNQTIMEAELFGTKIWTKCSFR